MNGFFIFWDKENDDLELLCEDGRFYFAGEDSVAVAQGSDDAYYWCELESLTDITPLNHCDRFDILHPETGEWVPYNEAPFELCRQVQKLAGVKEWREVL